jgi:hypothetical protein
MPEKAVNQVIYLDDIETGMGRSVSSKKSPANAGRIRFRIGQKL